MKESTLVNNILKYLNGLPNCKAIKRHGGMFGRAGEADIMGCIRGRHFEIEVKIEANLPTKIQHQRLLEWREAGALAFWTNCLEDVKRRIYAEKKESK